MLKRILKILRNLLIVLLLLTAAAYFAIQTPVVQTWLTHRVASYISKELGTTVMVGKVKVDLWARLVLEDLYIEDQKKDTLAYIPKLHLATYTYDSNTGKIEVAGAMLENPFINIVRHEGDTALNYKFIIDYVDKMSSPGDSTSTQIYLHNLTLKGGRVNYTNKNRAERNEFGIDWNRIQGNNLNLAVRDFSILGDSVHATINRLSFQEKSGFLLRDLQADLIMKGGDLQLNDAYIATNKSVLKGYLGFKFNSIDDIDNFETAVKMNHALDQSKLYMGDLAYFSSDMYGWDKEIGVSGKFKGTVASLKGKDVELLIDENTRFKGKFEMSGLPEMDQTFITMDIEELTTNKRELDRLQIPPFDSLHFLRTPDNFAQLGQITYRGNFTGFINDFVSIGNIHTQIGDANTDIVLRFDDKLDDYVYKGNLATVNFDLGKFYNSADLGPLNSNLFIDGRSLNLKKMNATFNGEISSVYLNGYNYTNIKVNEGKFALKKFNGDFTIDDPNASIEFNGSVDFNPADPLLDFTAYVQHMNLNALHILQKYDYSSVSGKVRVQSEGFEFEKFVGSIELDDITYCAGENDYYLSHLLLESTRKGEPKIVLDSDIAQAKITGDFEVREIGASILKIVSEIIPSFDAPVKSHTPQRFNLELLVFDAEQLTTVFMPELKIATNTKLDLKVDEFSNTFEIFMVSDSISYLNNKLEAIVIDAEKLEKDPALYATVLGNQLQIDGMDFPDFSLETRTDVDTLYAAIAWGDSLAWHKGDINSKLVIRSFDDLDFEFYNSSITPKGQQWYITPGSSGSLKGKELVLNKFEISNGMQWIKASGGISEDPLVIMNVELHEFDLNNLNAFTGSETKFYGHLGGTATIRNAYKNLIFTNDLTLRDFRINEYEAGYLCVQSSWDNAGRQLRVDGVLEKNATISNEYLKQTPLLFSGYYRPDDKKSPLNLTAQVKDLDLAFINEFLSPGIIDLQGFATGNIAITGQPEAPLMDGEAVLRDASIYVNYLNVRYYIEQQIGIYYDMFTFDHIRVRDQEGNPGFVTGQIMHDNFAEWNFDLVIDMDKPMLAMNTTEDLNPLYYGKAYATGSVNIYGYQDQLEFDCNLKTEKGTVMAMPMSGTSEQTFENFVRFVDANTKVEKPVNDFSGIKLNFNLEVTPDAEFKIIFDESVGDVMRGRGKGHLLLEITNLSTFSMYGLVEVTEGDYLFTLKNLVNKEFKVKPGGTLAWYGDPFASDIDMKALYRVNASLYDLIPDPRYQNGQRVPVDLVMKLTGKMMNPSVEFDIELPTVDQVTKSRVNAVISNEQERNRQAFALLVLRRFVSPPDVSSDHQSTNALAANSTELLSSQISNWLSQISDDFNLGFNYRPGDDISNEEIALALSTQLFNERLALTSNVGVSRNTSNVNQNASNLIGDIRVEYKITPEGKVKFLVYNESSDFRMTYTQQSPYTQGVGIMYQEEFDTMEEFWKAFRAMLAGEDRRRRKAELAQ